MEKLPKESSPEEIDAAIKKLLETLDGYAEIHDRLSPELQERWYEAEMEVEPISKISPSRVARNF